MALFSRSKTDDGLTLILDIGSGSVGAALAIISKTEIPKIVFTSREPLPFQPELDAERLLTLMEEALGKTCADIAKNGTGGYGKIRHVSVVLSSPWFLSRTKTLSIENIKQFAFTRSFAEGILKADESAYEKEQDVKESETSTLESQIISVKLNGYPIADPYGKRAQKAEVTAYESFVSKKAIERIRTKLLSAFGPRDISFCTFPLATYAVLRDSVSETGDFIFIEINRELTEVSLVKKGILLETSSFPYGKNHVIRLAEKSLKMAPESAMSELSMYFTGKVEARHAENIRKVAEEAGNDWSAMLLATLTKLSETHYLPEETYLISQNDFLPFFSECVNRASIARAGGASEDRSVRVLGQDDLKKYCSYENQAEADTFLAVGAIFSSLSSRNPHFDLYYKS